MLTVKTRVRDVDHAVRGNRLLPQAADSSGGSGRVDLRDKGRYCARLRARSHDGAKASARQDTHLRKVAYRMLGSVGEADDPLQVAWMRLSRSDVGDVQNLGSW